MATNKRFDVFLSHNSKDEAWVIQLKDALEARGINVWLDSDDIRPGDLFAKALEQGIQESKAVALIISPESMKSGWVEAEYYRALNLATNNNLQLIPVLYKKAKIPGFITDRSWVDFSDPATYEENVDDLIWGITGKKPASSPLQPTVPQQPANAPATSTPTGSSASPNVASNPGPINEPVDTLLERVVQFVLSASVLAGLILAVRYGISLKLLVPGGVIEWISASADPRLALWVVSTLIGSVIITLPKLGFKAEWAKKILEANHLLFTYLVGLSPWITVPISVAAIIGLFVLKPVCQSPAATIRVRTPSMDSYTYDGTPIYAAPGSELTLTATSIDSSLISCSWSSTGSAISSLSSRSTCTTQVQFADESGNGIITLSLSNSICSVQTTKPLQVIIAP